MEIKKYKDMIHDIMFSDDMTFGFIDDEKYKFFVRNYKHRVVFDRKNNTVTMPVLKDEIDPSQNQITPLGLMAKMRDIKPPVEYYIPTSKEDEFQASTSYDGNVLPFELAQELELLLSSVREDVSRYSMNRRIYK